MIQKDERTNDPNKSYGFRKFTAYDLIKQKDKFNVFLYIENDAKAEMNNVDNNFPSLKCQKNCH